jgi:hypothetical protein
VSSGDLAELGTGGIMKPVMIYKPGTEGTTAPEKPEKPKGVEYEM